MKQSEQMRFGADGRKHFPAKGDKRRVGNGKPYPISECRVRLEGPAAVKLIRVTPEISKQIERQVRYQVRKEAQKRFLAAA